jgi:hypothetical protein
MERTQTERDIEMINKLRQIAANMVISDQFLDLEEEALYFAKVSEYGIDRELSETILVEVLAQFHAVRESQLFAEMKRYMIGPLRDGFLSEAEEKNALSFLIRHAPQVSLTQVKELLKKICDQQNILTESIFREELLCYTQNWIHDNCLSEDIRQKIIEWASREKYVPEEEVDRMLELLCLEYGWQQAF